MNRLLIITFLIALSTSCKDNLLPAANIVTPKNTLRILTYGLIGNQGKSASSFIAKKYGFCYYPVAGCAVTKWLADSVQHENEKVYALLKQRYGKGWKKNFDNEVDSLSSLENRAEVLVNNQIFIQHTNKQLKSKGGLYYHISPAGADNIFIVTAYGPDTNNRRTNDIVYYNMKANLSSNTVTSLQ